MISHETSPRLRLGGGDGGGGGGVLRLDPLVSLATLGQRQIQLRLKARHPLLGRRHGVASSQAETALTGTFEKPISFFLFSILIIYYTSSHRVRKTV